MVCLRYAKSENNPFIGTRQTGSCSYTGILWPDFRQRGDTFCSEQGMAGDTPFTQTAFKGLASIPIAEARGFTLDLVNHGGKRLLPNFGEVGNVYPGNKGDIDEQG